MISFDSFIAQDGVPIYLQIVKHIKSGIVSGTVVNGDEVPSRRVLSALLGVNPNTIQKAYRILEEEGLICSHTGAKSAVSVTDAQVAQIRRELLQQETQSLVDAMKQMGVTKEEAVQMLQNLW